MCKGVREGDAISPRPFSKNPGKIFCKIEWGATYPYEIFDDVILTAEDPAELQVLFTNKKKKKNSTAMSLIRECTKWEQ